ncbi:MAG: DNA polymerase III subunit delta [Minisyncoccales bacterium]
MILIIAGPETYLSRKRLKELLKQSEKEKREIKFFDLEEKNYFLEIKREFFNINFFNQKKLFVLENSSLNKSFQEDFKKEIKEFSHSPNLIIFYEKGEISSKKEEDFFKTITKESQKEFFDFLRKKEVEKWLSEIEREKNFVFEKGAKEKIVELLGNNLWLIEKEIEKLLTFEEKRISLANVRKLISPQLTFNIFDTLEMLAKKNKKEVILMVRKHLENGDSPQFIFSMFIYQIRELIILKDLLEKTKNFFFLQKKIKKPYFVLRKMLNCLKYFTKEELKKLYQKLYLLDFQIRKGEILPEMSLFFFLNSV